MAVHFEIIRHGNLFGTRPDGGQEFAIGSKVTYSDQRRGTRSAGLANDGTAEAQQLLYDAAAYAETYGFWTSFIEPTAICEGRSFITLNTYDRAYFTFGFGQFAAHEPNGDFVLWFRDMLGLPDASTYFPDLKIDSGRISRLVGAATTALESDVSTWGLMTYLNPTITAIEDEEVLSAARLIYWTKSSAAARALQVKHMVSVAKQRVREADRRLNLNGKSALLCCIIFDILHQGRGLYSDMQDALLQPQPDTALLQIGIRGQSARCANLTKALTAARRAALSAKSWDSSAHDFV